MEVGRQRLLKGATKQQPSTSFFFLPAIHVAVPVLAGTGKILAEQIHWSGTREANGLVVRNSYFVIRTRTARPRSSSAMAPILASVFRAHPGVNRCSTAHRPCLTRTQLINLCGRLPYLKLGVLLAKNRVSCRQAHGSGLLFRPDPNSSCAAHQRERIVTDDLCGTVNYKLDGILGQRANRAKFIGDTKNYARRVCAIGDQVRIVWQENEL